jgi:hypothetical protein
MLTAAMLVAHPAEGQGPPLGASVTVSLLTFGPGEEVFERFGHNALRIRQPATGLDVAFNWGMFSFDQPRFIQRFLTGDTRYWMQGFNGRVFIAEYQAQHREVWEQELALTSSQKDSLVTLLDWTQREENRYYRYDYFRDNCSTRVRDALDGVIGGAIRRAAESHAHAVSYRRETLRLARAFPALNLGMDFALGPRADATSSGWEELFVPMRLRDLLRDVRVPGADGSLVPLVTHEEQLVHDASFVEAPAPPSMIPLGLSIGILTAALLFGLVSRPVMEQRALRWLFVGAASAWSLLVGSSGALLLFAGLFTKHVYMGANLNVLLATPLSIALAVLLPLACRSGASARLRGATWGLMRAAAVCAIAGALVTMVGPFAQRNGSAIASLLPGHLALVFVGHRTLRIRDVS